MATIELEYINPSAISVETDIVAASSVTVESEVVHPVVIELYNDEEECYGLPNLYKIIREDSGPTRWCIISVYFSTLKIKHSASNLVAAKSNNGRIFPAVNGKVDIDLSKEEGIPYKGSYVRWVIYYYNTDYTTLGPPYDLAIVAKMNIEDVNSGSYNYLFQDTIEPYRLYYKTTVGATSFYQSYFLRKLSKRADFSLCTGGGESFFARISVSSYLREIDLSTLNIEAISPAHITSNLSIERILGMDKFTYMTSLITTHAYTFKQLRDIEVDFSQAKTINGFCNNSVVHKITIYNGDKGTINTVGRTLWLAIELRYIYGVIDFTNVEDIANLSNIPGNAPNTLTSCRFKGMKYNYSTYYFNTNPTQEEKLLVKDSISFLIYNVVDLTGGTSYSITVVAAHHPLFSQEEKMKFINHLTTKNWKLVW